MCFYVSKKHPDKKIAKRDISCYKVVELSETPDLFISSYQGFPYILGKLYCIQGTLFKMAGLIHSGLHAYSNKRKLCFFFSDETTVKCIIPKGSEYYYNPKDGEYVSNQIIIKGLLK